VHETRIEAAAVTERAAMFVAAALGHGAAIRVPAVGSPGIAPAQARFVCIARLWIQPCVCSAAQRHQAERGAADDDGVEQSGWHS